VTAAELPETCAAPKPKTRGGPPKPLVAILIVVTLPVVVRMKRRKANVTVDTP
jgi:hypothetical protein